ncbi:hypothetical protein B0A55_01875 [Friedmanniomyces simplex]|uniref:Uncharacterized protein n=1 Tax=Friedmanniomyces simplex TaxID=329884 RepID=A0A4U0XXJ0_9PEZI|nr:hypothetical protein B0A55_01875 [Friedmanniomyces simplex]
MSDTLSGSQEAADYRDDWYGADCELNLALAHQKDTGEKGGEPSKLVKMVRNSNRTPLKIAAHMQYLLGYSSTYRQTSHPNISHASVVVQTMPRQKSSPPAVGGSGTGSGMPPTGLDPA